jgi:hypothetical protein
MAEAVLVCAVPRFCSPSPSSEATLGRQRHDILNASDRRRSHDAAWGCSGTGATGTSILVSEQPTRGRLKALPFREMSRQSHNGEPNLAQICIGVKLVVCSQTRSHHPRDRPRAELPRGRTQTEIELSSMDDVPEMSWLILFTRTANITFPERTSARATASEPIGMFGPMRSMLDDRQRPREATLPGHDLLSLRRRLAGRC